MKIAKSPKGEMATMIGGLLVVFGITAMSLSENNYFIFGLLLSGLVVVIYGIFASATRVKSKEEEGLN